MRGAAVSGRASGLAFSAITAYEIIRGLHANRATRQLAAFLKTVGTSDVFPVSMPVLMRAAELWADARNGGHPQDDAELATAVSADGCQPERGTIQPRPADKPAIPSLLTANPAGFGGFGVFGGMTTKTAAANP